ncbi:MAG: ABC transporter permease [Anaerolineae bacterium]|nr:ABC transporter permease [Anaerolineae bacterium]
MSDLSAAAAAPTDSAGILSRWRTVVIPLLAVLTAVFIGSLFIVLTSVFSGNGATLGENFALGLQTAGAAFSGLLDGAFGDASGLTRTLVKTAPLALSGLAVAFAFKGGLFNIGAQGQLIMGSVTSAWVGFALHVDLGNPVLSTLVHVTLSVLAGAVGGALWGAIPGFLKAYTGAHEVISTIMFNYIASNLISWLLYAGSPGEGIPPGPLNDGNGVITRTPTIQPTAQLPVVFDPPGPQFLHLGIFIAIAAAVLVLILVNRTTFGFELRMVGLNPTAAKYSGINVKRITIMTMVIAGVLAGTAGAMQTLGVNYRYEPNQSLGLGFDAITVALLGANNPLGVLVAAFLFGAMDAGSTRMQFNSGVPSEIIVVIQALILMFVAAEQIIRTVYRIRGEGGPTQRLSTGWGQR